MISTAANARIVRPNLMVWSTGYVIGIMGQLGRLVQIKSYRIANFTEDFRFNAGDADKPLNKAFNRDVP